MAFFRATIWLVVKNSKKKQCKCHVPSLKRITIKILHNPPKGDRREDVGRACCLEKSNNRNGTQLAHFFAT